MVVVFFKREGEFKNPNRFLKDISILKGRIYLKVFQIRDCHPFCPMYFLSLKYFFFKETNHISPIFTNFPGHFYSFTQQVFGATWKAHLWNRNPGSGPPTGRGIETTWFARRLRPSSLQWGSGEVAQGPDQNFLSENLTIPEFFFLKNPSPWWGNLLTSSQDLTEEIPASNDWAICHLGTHYAEICPPASEVQSLGGRSLPAPTPGLCPAHLLARVWEAPKLLTCDRGRLYFSGQE